MTIRVKTILLITYAETVHQNTKRNFVRKQHIS